jgi:threonine/homoserine/homoserine lactone efflux protein
MYLGKWLMREKIRRWFNRCSGGLLAAIGVSFLLVRRG